MKRTKLELPESFQFSCQIPVRITDLNYSGHTGNDAVLSIIHEARMQFLKSIGYTEMNFEGSGMIMADVTIEFKHELFYGDMVIASVAAGEVSRVGFDLFYKLEIDQHYNGNKKIVAATARTRMICYDYTAKKIISVPDKAKEKLLK